MAAVFLDLHGVVVDIRKLTVEYQRLAGEILAPALGGEPGDWGRAARAIGPVLREEYLRRLADATDPTEMNGVQESERVRLMCEWLGFPAPDQETSERLGREMNAYVRTHGTSHFPEAPDAIRSLASRHTVHMASSIASWDTEAQLRGMGIRELVGLACGPDLVGVVKNSPEFYERLFELAGVSSSEAVVVDDTLALLEMAASVGATTVHISPDALEPSTAGSGAATITVSSIAQVPQALAQLVEVSA